MWTISVNGWLKDRVQDTQDAAQFWPSIRCLAHFPCQCWITMSGPRDHLAPHKNMPSSHPAIQPQARQAKQDFPLTSLVWSQGGRMLIRVLGSLVTTEAPPPHPILLRTTKAHPFTSFFFQVEQLRIDFIKFDIAPPESGLCSNESLEITGADAVTMKNLPMNLCGVLTGQHVYLSVKTSEMVTITIKVTSDSTQEWELLVRQFEADQTEYLAPRGCLQYFKEDAATFSTFNNNAGAGELLNDHMYSVCIADNDAYCDVSLTASNFDLTEGADACSDAVAFGTSAFCGSTFANAGSLICMYLSTKVFFINILFLGNYTGAYQIPMMSDGDNAAMVAGYEISYILLPC